MSEDLRDKAISILEDFDDWLGKEAEKNNMSALELQEFIKRALQ